MINGMIKMTSLERDNIFNHRQLNYLCMRYFNLSPTKIFKLCIIGFLCGGPSHIYSAVPIKRGQLSPTFSQNTSHSWPVRARYWIYLTDSNCDLYPASVIAVMYAISCWIRQRYNGIRLYIYIYIYIYAMPATGEEYLWFGRKLECVANFI